MYVFAEVDAYLQLLSYTDVYKEKTLEERQQLVFTAYDKLLSYYDDIYLTPKIIGLQTVYVIEGEEEEFAKFKRHGVSSMGLKGISFSFDGTDISPEVQALVAKEIAKAKPSSARVGRLI